MPAYPPLDSPELKPNLRPAREPVRCVNDDLVHALLLDNTPAFLEHLEQGLRDIATGRAELQLPPKTVFEDGPGKGDFRLMPCILRRDGRVVKSVKLVGTNLAQQDVPDQVTVGKAMLLHAEENYVTHLFDASTLSSIRTGACVALALRLLAPRRRRVGIVGAGRVGFYSAVFIRAIGGVEAMRITDIVPARANALARLLSGLHPDIDCATGRHFPDDNADVVVLATTSSIPLCRPPAGDAALVVSVGADTDYQRELDPAWADAADIVVDTLDSARFGDLRAWLENGRIRREDLRDLFDVLRRPPETGRPILFVSTGSALFDNLTLDYLAQRLPPADRSSETKSSCL